MGRTSGLRRSGRVVALDIGFTWSLAVWDPAQAYLLPFHCYYSSRCRVGSSNLSIEGGFAGVVAVDARSLVAVCMSGSGSIVVSASACVAVSRCGVCVECGVWSVV